jgi:magnesium transporter
MKKRLLPIRDSINKLEKGVSGLIELNNIKYFIILREKCLQVLEDIESNIQLLDSKVNLLLSFQSNRMNEIMKILTLVSTIFIPLTFIAGVYGMNFKYMPELELDWAYFALLGIMGVIFISMLLFFKHKKWF